MLVIRLQRTGRKGHAMFRVVVQDSRQTPASGKVVAWLGSYDPHSKQVLIDKEKVSFYLEHGAQPSDRLATLLKAEGIKLPKWVTVSPKKKGAVRSPEKRRSTRPAEAEPTEPAEEVKPSEEPEAAETVAEETPSVSQENPEEPAELSVEPASEEVSAEEPVEQAEEIKEEPEQPSVEEPTEETPAKA